MTANLFIQLFIHWMAHQNHNQAYHGFTSGKATYNCKHRPYCHSCTVDSPGHKKDDKGQGKKPCCDQKPPFFFAAEVAEITFSCFCFFCIFHVKNSLPVFLMSFSLKSWNFFLQPFVHSGSCQHFCRKYFFHEVLLAGSDIWGQIQPDPSCRSS